MAEEYLTHVSDRIERKVIKKRSEEILRTESRILGALSKLDEFLLNPQVRTCSVALRRTYNNNNSENWESTGDRSVDDPCPELRFSACHNSTLNDSVQDETHHMVTGVQEDFTYCSFGTSSGKQNKTRSTSQPQFCSDNTPATIEADQILLALQQLATNSNSAIINNNINRISKMPKSLTTTKITSDGKSEKIEVIESLQSNHGRRQKKLPLSQAGRCTTNIQKRQQLQQRHFGRSFGCVP